MSAARILVIDAAETSSTYRSGLGKRQNYQLVTAGDLKELQNLLSSVSLDLAIVAVDVPDLDGFSALERLREHDAELPVIAVADESDMPTALRCLRAGAADLLIQPLKADELQASVERLLALRRKDEERELLRSQIDRSHHFEEYIGSSPGMQRVFSTIDRVAGTDVDVLILGETGTGKELAAKAIHLHSDRAEKPFVPVDCGAIPENLLESEFFGYEKGAFTGAEQRRIGLLEYADGGTFFLDEVAELPLLLQAKLLRVLQERHLRRVGGHDQISVDVRIVAATSRDLDEMVRRKQFREDLFYRINVVRVSLPPLRERGDDLGLLAEAFAGRFSREMGRPVVGIAPETYQVLSQYRWPGNIRELQNVIRRAIALTTHTLIQVDDLPDEVVAAAGTNAETPHSGFFQQREQCVREFERSYLRNCLREHHGNVTTAAQEAQLPRGTFYRLMKNHGIDTNQFR